jgi:hypothetical protein
LSDKILVHSQKGENMRRKWFVFFSLVIVSSMLFAACTPQPDVATEEIEEVEEVEEAEEV